MAYFDENEYFPVWLPDSLPEHVVAGVYAELLDAKDRGDGEGVPDNSLHGFIVRDWFGPFLLGPPTRFLGGRC